MMGIRSLSNNVDIVIKKADKGFAIVIQNTSDYILEGVRQLSDTKFYVETDDDLTSQHQQEISHLLNTLVAKDEISEECRNYLDPANTKASRFYLLPKIHKRLPNPPGRPIVSSNNSPTEKISAFVDHFLQPCVPKLQSFVKDTGDFISKLNEIKTIPDNAILVTFDVTSLYTNIPTEEGIQAAAYFLNKENRATKMPTNQSIIRLLPTSPH